MEISIVVPVYNSSRTLYRLAHELRYELDRIASQYELILVNDGSHDESWQIISQLTSQFDWVRGIDLMRNYGQHNALLCGIRAARYEYTITMDDDLQNPPNQIPNLVAKLEEGYDLVYGKYDEKQNHGFFRNLTSKISKRFIMRSMGIKGVSEIGPYRAFRTCLRDGFFNYRDPYVCVDVLLSWSTKKIIGIPVVHDKRLDGKSQYNLKKLVATFFNLITGFSVLPLRLICLYGIICVGFGILCILFIFSVWLIEGRLMPGFPFLACLIILFAGAQLLALGVIGEYIARMYLRSMQSPSYVVREDSKLSINSEKRMVSLS